MLDFVKCICGVLQERSMRRKIPSLLTPPSEQLWLAGALNL